MTLASTPDLPGHRPLRGAIVDVHPDGSDAPDPLLWWRPAIITAEGKAHGLVATSVAAERCEDGAQGVIVRGTVDGARIEHRVCPEGADGVVLTTHAEGIPTGSRLGDEVNPGSASVILDTHGERWEGEFASRSMVLAERGVALVLTAHNGERPEARRHFVRIAAESFPSPVVWVSTGATFVRHARVLRGDVFDGIAAAHGASARVIDLVAPAPGELDLVAADGEVLATGGLPEVRRRVALPVGLGRSLRTRDLLGVASAPVELPEEVSPTAVTVRAQTTPSGALHVALTDGSHGAPTHVLFKGLDGTDDPSPRLAPTAHGHSSGRSVYLLDGAADLRLPIGHYRVTASRGTGYTLASAVVAVRADAPARFEGTLTRVPEMAGWVAGDFHLHAAPSPDSRVSLAERVASLVCNGVEVMAATDHNRITDDRPDVHAQGLDGQIAVIAGDEITSAGQRLWGHFNAFPLPVVVEGEAPDDRVPAYFDRTPEAMFREARAMGASVVMVNHPRMPPSIGYFDLTHLDPRTGTVGEGFSGDFNAVEAFNGIWLQSPDRVREGLRDIVALARHGLRVSAVGNSDSHQLLFEEAGYPRTWLRVTPGPPETLQARAIDALRAGRTAVSSGPIVELHVGETSSGDTTVVRGSSVRVHVQVVAPAWVPVERIEVWRDDVVVARATATRDADGLRYEGDLTVPLSADAMLSAWAEATRPLPDVMPYTDARAIGFSGPLWIDHDGDGRVQIPPGAPSVTAPRE